MLRGTQESIPLLCIMNTFLTDLQLWKRILSDASPEHIFSGMPLRSLLSVMHLHRAQRCDPWEKISRTRDLFITCAAAGYRICYKECAGWVDMERPKGRNKGNLYHFMWSSGIWRTDFHGSNLKMVSPVWQKPGKCDTTQGERTVFYPQEMDSFSFLHHWVLAPLFIRSVHQHHPTPPWGRYSWTLPNSHHPPVSSPPHWGTSSVDTP